MPTQLRGKGLWAYAHGDLNDFNHRISHALSIAPQLGITHVLFKVGQGAKYYEDRAAEARKRIEQAGLTPFAWMWLTLSDPHGEALTVKHAFDDGYQGFVFDMEEHTNPQLSAEGRTEEATELGVRLNQLGVDPHKLYLCSFPNIYWHRTLPYDQMARFCRGGTMPMAYGTFTSWGASTVIDDWTYGHHQRWCTERNDPLPVYPALAPYVDEAGNDQMGPAQFSPWLDALTGHAPTFFSLFSARSVSPTIFSMVKAFELGGEDVHHDVHHEEDRIVLIVESPAVGFLRLRARATTSSSEVARIPHATQVYSMEDEGSTKGKVNQLGKWLHIRTPEGLDGYVAAWYLRWPDQVSHDVVVQPDTRVPANDTVLPFGQSSWIYGMHAASINDDPAYKNEIRNLFEGTGKRGWVLFTEQFGHDINGIQPIPARKAAFWDWAHSAGYGVIVRLNHGYDTAGTLPRSQHYQAFADCCARYAELYLKHADVSSGLYRWVIIVGNEQNNPREWPRENQLPEKITPQLYAQAFNKAYKAIKNVLGNSAVVAPGAVDPYNAALQRPLDYFSDMLDGIEQLDAIILHTYTHGHSVDAVTHPKKFDNDPLTDHYYDFMAYRPFMERIPAKWRGRPVYITETNPLFKSKEGDWGWYDDDIGWIEAAYAEIDRWNNTAHAQQIQALLLYRWAGDEWTMRGKGRLRDDFRDAIARNYRWRV